MGIREGDIEALRSKMKDQGRPIKSNTIREADGKQTHFTINKKSGRVKITERNN